MSYEILDHTADEKFRASGNTLEEAFSESVEAFSEIVGDGEKGSYRHSIEIESENLEALLFDFIDRLIFIQDTEGVIITGTKQIEIKDLEDGWSLDATLLADTLSPGGSYLDIKGPTYNEMEIDQRNGEWIIQVVLDI